MSLVWWTKPNGRGRICVEENDDERPRPWISLYPRGRSGYFVVCWMCPTDGGLLSKICKSREQARRFVLAHRRCGFALDPAPDPRAPKTAMDYLADLLEEPTG